MGFFEGKDLKIVNTAGINGIESGMIVSATENTWTREDGLFELSDNKIDIGAKLIKFVKGYDKEREQFYLDVYHNGKRFKNKEDFVKFVTEFVYHNTHGNKTPISLMGVGRRYACYVLSGYSNWGEKGESTYMIEALDEEGYLHRAIVTIRKPKQFDDDVRFLASIKADDWDKWYVCKERQYLDRDINFAPYIHDLKKSYPDKQDVEFVFEDEIEGTTETCHSYDPTYAVRFFGKEYDYLWEDAAKSPEGITIDETEEGVGIFLLHWFNSPCGKSFRAIDSLLYTSFLQNEHKTDKTKEKIGARGVSHHSGGIYAYRGGRLINRGNTKHLAPKLAHDRGGVGNCRLLIDLSDDDVAKDFNVSGNKSNGIGSIERSEKLNPNRTGFDTTVGPDRYADKFKSDKFVPGLYDYFIRFYNDAYYGPYCEKLSEGSGKENSIESKAIKKSKPKIEKENVKLKPKEQVLKEIGSAKAVTSIEVFEEPEGLTRYNIIESKEFSDILDEILDYIEINGMVIDGETHSGIMNYLRDNTSKHSKTCKNSNLKVLSLQ